MLYAGQKVACHGIGLARSTGGIDITMGFGVGDAFVEQQGGQLVVIFVRCADRSESLRRDPKTVYPQLAIAALNEDQIKEILHLVGGPTIDARQPALRHMAAGNREKIARATCPRALDGLLRSSSYSSVVQTAFLASVSS